MKALSDDQVVKLATRFRALGEPTRIRIVEVLARGKQPVSAVVNALRADQSNISKHLQVLFHAGLVTRQRSASTVIYALADRDLVELFATLRRSGARQRRGVSRTAPHARAADRGRRARAGHRS